MSMYTHVISATHNTICEIASEMIRLLDIDIDRMMLSLVDNT